MQLHLQLWQDLIALCSQLNHKQYTHKSLWLNGVSIGEHLRHTFEFYDCLLLGLETGTVNYDERKRNTEIANNCAYAIEVMEVLIDRLKTVQTDFSIELMTKESALPNVQTSLARELVYCLDHAIHHQALIKIGLKELGCYALVNEDFGVAYSTLRYRAEKKN